MHGSFKIYLTQPGLAARFWATLHDASLATYRDNCLGIAKGAAYSALLSFFPVLTTLATLLVQAKAEAVSRTIARILYDVVPPGTEDVVRMLFVVHGERPKWLLVVAGLLALWGASGAMISLMEGFRAVYHIPSGRSFIKDRGMAILLVFTTAVPVVGASALIVFGTRTERTIMQWLGNTEFTGWVSVGAQIMRYSAAFLTFVLVTALVYYLGPNRKQDFRRVFPGAVLATLLWLLTTIAFGWYVRNVANYNVLYGSVGAGLALLVWMYVLAVIALLGCEFNAARERMIAAAPALYVP
jgi:membrane protein